VAARQAGNFYNGRFSAGTSEKNGAGMIAERHFKNEDDIKAKIVEGYKRGVCDKNGKTKPKHLQGGSYGGSSFMPPISEEYRKNYVRIFSHD